MYVLEAGAEMKSRKGPRSDTEAFREAMAGVRPLEPGNRHTSERTRHPPVPAQTRRDEENVLRELLDHPGDSSDFETGEELLYLGPGHPPRLLRRLRRGDFSIADSIDLHHMGARTAAEVLHRFLAAAVRNGSGCVRIVHGKGLRSRDRPVLKQLTGRILRKHPAVIAFASCRPADGGTGAVLVLLRDRPQRAR